MKKITELYEEILQDDGLKAEFVEAAKDNQMEAFLQKNDCNATPSELQEFAKKEQSELVSLSDAELAAAASGAIWREPATSIVGVGIECAIAAKYSDEHGGSGWRKSDGEWLCRDY